MPDRVASFPVICKGGLIQNQGRLNVAQRPGAAIELVNFEPSDYGGYRRITGYGKFDPNQLPGQNRVLGCAVYYGGVLAARETNTDGVSQLYFSDRQGWTTLGGQRSSVKKFDFHEYYLPDRRIAIVDGVSKPAKWDRKEYTVIEDGPVAAERVAAFKNHLVLTKDTKLIISAPNQDENFSGVDGAVEINVGDRIQDINAWKDNLIIFCANSIFVLSGTSSFDFQLQPLSRNLGCIAPDSVAEVAGQLLFLSPDGIRPIQSVETTGDFSVGSVSRNIREKLKTLERRYIGQDITAVVLRDKSQYRLLFGSPNRDRAETEGILLGIRSDIDGQNMQEWYELQGIKASDADSGYAGNSEIAVFGGYDGYVYELGGRTDFDGNPVNEKYKTPYLTFEDPLQRDQLQNMYANIRKEGPATINVDFDFEYGNPSSSSPQTRTLFNETTNKVFGTATFGNTQFYVGGEDIAQTKLVGSGYNVSLTYTSTDGSSPYTIQEFILERTQSGRR